MDVQNGWAECREKKIGIEPMGSTFFLTSPLIGHCYMGESYVRRSLSFVLGTRNYCGGQPSAKLAELQRITLG